MQPGGAAFFASRLRGGVCLVLLWVRHDGNGGKGVCVCVFLCVGKFGGEEGGVMRFQRPFTGDVVRVAGVS